MRRLLLAALLLLGCSGGLNTDQGNAFPCDFNQGEGARDKACPSGWVCGVANLCQQNANEGIPKNLPFPHATSVRPLSPLQLDQPITAVAGDPFQGNFLVQMADGKNHAVVGGWVAMQGGAPQDLPAFSSASFLDQPLDGGMAHFAITAGASSEWLDLNTFAFPQSPQIGVSDYPGGADFVRRHVLFTGSSPVVLSRDAGAEIVEVVLDGGVPVEVPGGARLTPASSGATIELDDLRPIQSQALGGAVGTTDFDLLALQDLLPSGGKATPTLATLDLGLQNGTWVPASLTLDVAQGGGIFPELRPSLDGRVIALAEDPFSIGDFFQRPTELRVWTVESGNVPKFHEAWPACGPCPIGLIAFNPINVGAPAVEVLCRGASGAVPVLVVGSDGLGNCLEQTFDPGIEASEISAVDHATTGGVTVAGSHGQLWIGAGLSQLFPLYLDRVPTGVGEVVGPDPFTGQLKAVAMAFADGQFFVPLTDNGFVNFSLQLMVQKQADFSGFPAAAISGARGWFITNGGFVIAPQPRDPRAHDVQLVFGPVLLGPTGAVAQGPFVAEAMSGATPVVTDAGVTLDGPSGTFVIAANDSLYSWDPEPSGLSTTSPKGTLFPRLTPQPGFPIRSLALDRSSTTLRGYLATSNNVYAFADDGTPPHFHSQQLILPGEQPVAVWMASDTSSNGRVGFADGTVYTLPSVLPLTHPLPAANGQAMRVLQYANLLGWPLALTDHGLFIAARGQGADAGSTAVLDWQKLLSPAQEAQLVPVASGPMLMNVFEGSEIQLYGAHGQVFAISVDAGTP